MREYRRLDGSRYAFGQEQAALHVENRHRIARCILDLQHATCERDRELRGKTRSVNRIGIFAVAGRHFSRLSGLATAAGSYRSAPG